MSHGRPPAVWRLTRFRRPTSASSTSEPISCPLSCALISGPPTCERICWSTSSELLSLRGPSRLRAALPQVRSRSPASCSSLSFRNGRSSACRACAHASRVSLSMPLSCRTWPRSRSSSPETSSPRLTPTRPARTHTARLGVPFHTAASLVPPRCCADATVRPPIPSERSIYVDNSKPFIYCAGVQQTPQRHCKGSPGKGAGTGRSWKTRR